MVLAARVDWLAALAEGDDVFTARFGIPVVPGWVGFPEALAAAIEGARRRSEDPWGTHLFFDDDGALVGFGGFKGPPRDGEVELGYAVAPSRQGRGIATAVVEQLISRARTADVRIVSAHTLAEENASTAVLRKCGFVHTGQSHESVGDVWRWEYVLSLPFVQATGHRGDDHVGMTLDITKAPIHLGLGGTARPVDDFDWSEERLAAYDRATRADGADGRMVMMFHMAGAWTTWERHPLGAEVVIACTGTHRFVQELDDGEHVVEITAGEALINPPGVWHTADSGDGGWIVTITPGLDTEHRPR